MRILDCLLGALGLPLFGLLLPVFSLFALRFETRNTLVVGKDARLFHRRLLAFRPGWLKRPARWLGLAHVYDCVSLIRGDLAIVGPRPLPPLEPHAVASYRILVRPGLLSPRTLQQWAHTVCEPEADADYTYGTTRTWKTDVGLLARALLGKIHGVAQPSRLSRIEVDGIQVDNVTLDDAVSRIMLFLDQAQVKRVSVVNANAINQAGHDEGLRRALKRSDLVLGDGAGISLFSRLMGEPLRETIAAVDLFEGLCKALEGGPHAVYLLGGEPGVAGAVATWIQSRYSECRIAGFEHGYFDASEEAEVIADIRRSGATLLLAALGTRTQELWLRDHLASSGARVGIGVGGLFNFISGRRPRAPVWMRELGLEWAYRLAQDPRRLFWRYGPGSVEFLGRALRAAFRKRILPAMAFRNAH